MKNDLQKKNWLAAAYMALMLILLTATISFPQNISLNGEWQIVKNQLSTIEPNNIDTVKSWRTAKVPYSWHLLYEDLMDYQGVVWYRKSININNKEDNKRYILHFGAVDYMSRLYVNRKFIGEHEGGYTPFSFDITKELRKGDNEILLRVMDPATDSIGTEGISYWNIPHGKQSWYVQNSGIWQNVFISVEPEIFISRTQINANINGEFTSKIFLDGVILEKQNLLVKIYSPGNEKVFERVVENVNSNMITINGKVNLPQLWDTENPNLYYIKIKFGEDEHEDRFGFREFINKDGKFYLNGKPFYMISVLDQNFYPETVYQFPSEAYLHNEMIKAKQLGINTMRCHIKVPEPEYLKIADELGLLVWYEIPNWDVFNESVKARSRYTLDKMLERDWNHPSLVVISIINESWGIDLKIAEQRQWLINEFDYAKAAAPGRLIVDNSACWGNFHLKTDINDYHIYYSIPENYKNFSAAVKDIASRPKWLFSSHGDSHETGKEVLLLSEFGNWGLPKLPEKLPFWFNRKFGNEIEVLPDGVYKRFSDFKYNRIFKSYDKLAEVSQRAEFTALKYEIEEIRLQNPIQGYVITEFTDVNWECNGLLDMWRNFKENHNELSDIQKPDAIISRADKFNYWDDETASIKIFVSHYGDFDLSNARILWSSSSNKSGEVVISEIEKALVKEISEINLSFSNVKQPQKVTVNFNLMKDDKLIAKNFTEVFVYPKKINENKILIYADSENQVMKNLAEKLAVRGFELSGDKKNVVITNSINEKVIDELKAGVNVVCIADGGTKNIYRFPFEIISRDSAGLDGNWASNLNWIDDVSPIFKKISFDKKLGFEAVNTVPRFVIGSVPAENFDDVPAGMFLGWVHANYPFMAQMKVGKGNLILTTFRIAENYGIDPYATILLDEILKYIGSEECNPNLKWN